MLSFLIFQVTSRALDIINPDKKLPLHVSLDIDVLDPIEAPATGTRGNICITIPTSIMSCNESSIKLINGEVMTSAKWSEGVTKPPWSSEQIEVNLRVFLKLLGIS